MRRQTSPLLRFALDRYRQIVMSEGALRQAVALVGELRKTSPPGREAARLERLEADALAVRRKGTAERKRSELAVEAQAKKEGASDGTKAKTGRE